ncbi:MAG: hypothetical protein JSV09_09465 [Thermoplasmata archaeon]|nr:MAG: hypothetical protein JSV09_09465 [Thermoplasmata archaeon]
MNEDVNRKNMMISPVIYFLIGLISFVIGICLILKRSIQLYLDIRTEYSNLEATLSSGLFSIGLIFLIFGIVIFLYEHTSKLISLRDKVLYQFIILLSFLFALILEIISEIILYNAYENLGGISDIDQFYLASALGSISKFGLISMFLIILVFLIRLYNMGKFETMMSPPNMKGELLWLEYKEMG